MKKLNLIEEKSDFYYFLLNLAKLGLQVIFTAIGENKKQFYNFFEKFEKIFRKYKNKLIKMLGSKISENDYLTVFTMTINNWNNFLIKFEDSFLTLYKMIKNCIFERLNFHDEFFKKKEGELVTENDEIFKKLLIYYEDLKELLEIDTDKSKIK